MNVCVAVKIIPRLGLRAVQTEYYTIHNPLSLLQTNIQ
jgi:hypothetical protein